MLVEAMDVDTDNALSVREARRPVSKRFSKMVEHQRMLLRQSGHLLVAKYVVRLRHFFGPQIARSHTHVSVDCSRLRKRKTLLSFFLRSDNIGAWAPPQVWGRWEPLAVASRWEAQGGELAYTC